MGSLKAGTLMLLGLCAITSSAWPSDVTSAAFEPDFALIEHFARLNASIRYDSSAAIERTWSAHYEQLYIVEVTQTRNRYLLGIDDRRRVQDVAIRGTTNLRNAIYDLRFLKAYSPLLGIYVHRGFGLMAAALDANIEPYLRRDYSLRISGQSLGAAEALILAMRLRARGYRVDRVLTFGQPKVTDSAGAAAYAALPLLRVADVNDVVPLLPPARLVYRHNPYVHFGREVVLLSPHRYCLATESFADRAVPDAVVDRIFTRHELSTLLREHSIRTYLSSVEELVSRAIPQACPARASAAAANDNR